MSAPELLSRLGSSDLRLADVRWYLGEPDRGRSEYAAGHLPGAVFVDLDADLSAPSGPGRHPLPDAEDFRTRMSALGFGDEDVIVAYDDVSGIVASRLWWMLDALGHRSVSVLDGGLRAWRDIGGPMTAEVPEPSPAQLTLAPDWPRVVDRAWVVARLGAIDLVDLRAGERYRGEVEPVDPAAGHIPTARNLPATDLLGSDGRLLPPDELASHLTSMGPRDEPPVLSCGSGVTACLGLLAHRVGGLPDPLLYPGSFSDWSRAGLPVATGPDPGGWRSDRSRRHEPTPAAAGD
jgi:thiosulfate/3-mercaptopyruvate sulfurtransferase